MKLTWSDYQNLSVRNWQRMAILKWGMWTFDTHETFCCLGFHSAFIQCHIKWHWFFGQFDRKMSQWHKISISVFCLLFCQPIWSCYFCLTIFHFIFSWNFFLSKEFLKTILVSFSSEVPFFLLKLFLCGKTFSFGFLINTK